jgi:hypothetical protein
MDAKRGNYHLKEGKLAPLLVEACGLNAAKSHDAQQAIGWWVQQQRWSPEQGTCLTGHTRKLPSIRKAQGNDASPNMHLLLTHRSTVL